MKKSKPSTNPLLPLRPNRHTVRDDRHLRQSLMVRQIHRLESSEKGLAGLYGCASAVQSAEPIL